VGIGEATGSGPAQSLLADSYPPDRRATALAVLVMGGPIGSMVAFAGGGWLADLYGWRAAFIVFGAPGLVLAILIRTLVPEPQRGAFDRTNEGVRPDTRPLSFTAALRFLVSVPTVRTIALASGCNAVGLYAVLVWSVPYMTRVHGLSTGEAGLQLAIAAGLSTALGTLAGGRLGDRLARRDLRWLAWLPGMTLALILPFAWGFAFASSAALAVSLLALASFLAGTANGPTFSIVHTIAAPQTRALAGAGVTIVNNAFGLGVAPPVVGWLNDLGAPSFGDEAIRYSLALILTVHGAAAFFCLRSASTLHRDLDAKLRLEEIER
jgi:predicted MFS family arabinose efflux permease